MKYNKGISIARGINIMITNKDSFEECDNEIREELSRHPEISVKDKMEIEKVLS